VADTVLGCSDSLVEDPEDKLPWRERKDNYLAHLENASASVCMVSAADKLHNVRSIIRDYREHGEEIWDRFQGRRDGTLWYYETVADTLLRRYRTPLTRDLQNAVDELLELASFTEEDQK
jgi:(p)ppGpp synthase/HD superfamily hydrolase